jgi:hypothetical protein
MNRPKHNNEVLVGLKCAICYLEQRIHGVTTEIYYHQHSYILALHYFLFRFLTCYFVNIVTRHGR